MTVLEACSSATLLWIVALVRASWSCRRVWSVARPRPSGWVTLSWSAVS